MKNTKFTRSILLGLVMLAATAVSAQKFKVETVAGKLISPVDRTSQEWFTILDECVEDIEMAAQHPKTQAFYKMHYYRGVTYLSIYREGSAEQKAKYSDALEIATKSFFACLETDEKERFRSFAEQKLLDCAIGNFNQGVVHYNAQEYEKAIASYAEALKILPLDKEGELKRRNITEQTLIQYSYYSAMAKGDNAATKGYINKLIDLGFQDPKIYMDLVRVYLAEKDTSNALKYIELGKDLAPDDVNLINTELDIYLKQGRSQELIDKLTTAIETDPSNRIYYFARAISYEKLEEPDKAEADYKKAIEVDPAYGDAYYNLGVIYINKCRPIADKIDNSQKMSEIEELEKEIDVLYIKAAEQFENALEYGEYEEAARTELMGTLKRIYARLIQTNSEYEQKYKDIKAELGE